MQVVDPQQISGKKVILRLDIDVPLRESRVKSQESREVVEDFRLRAGLPTLKLCLENASEVIVIGHIGRPEGKIVPELSVEPIRDWLVSQGLNSHLTSGKLKVLENLRFDPRESFDFAQDKEAMMGFAKELAGTGDLFINESFASYHPAVSTTILPTLLPHFAGLQFAKEVEKLTKVRDNPKKPYVTIMGGAKVKDKLPVIQVLAQKADAVLVGGKLISEIREQNLDLPKNVMVGMLTEDGFDIAPETIDAWSGLISKAAMIVWNGPVGKIEENTWKVGFDSFQVENFGSARGTYELAKMVLNSPAEVVVGGGDTVGFLGQVGLLGEFEQKGLPAGRQGFVSTGGGAMLKFLTDGTLPTIEVLS